RFLRGWAAPFPASDVLRGGVAHLRGRGEETGRAPHLLVEPVGVDSRGITPGEKCLRPRFKAEPPHWPVGVYGAPGLDHVTKTVTRDADRVLHELDLVVLRDLLLRHPEHVVSSCFSASDVDGAELRIFLEQNAAEVTTVASSGEGGLRDRGHELA